MQKAQWTENMSTGAGKILSADRIDVMTSDFSLIY
jgi:hypothetical protein